MGVRHFHSLSGLTEVQCFVFCYILIVFQGPLSTNLENCKRLLGNSLAVNLYLCLSGFIITFIIILHKISDLYFCCCNLSVVGKYMQMMNVLKPIAFDVVICMSQLFDYYLFAVSITFICYGQYLYWIWLGIRITLRQLPNDQRKKSSFTSALFFVCSVFNCFFFLWCNDTSNSFSDYQ